MRWYSIVVITLLAGLVVYLWLQKQDADRSLASVRIAANQEIEVWRDKYGQANAQAEQLRINRDLMRRYYEDRIAKVPGKVTEIQTIEIVTKDTIELVTVDTIFQSLEHGAAVGKIFEASDKWGKFEIYNLGFAPAIQYHVRDSITITEFSSRRGLLGRREYFVRGVSHNPNTTIMGLESVKVYEAKRFSVGPYVGYGFNGRTFAPQIGVGVQYKMFEF